MDKRRYPRLSLDLLRGFRVAARHLSFTRAAQELFVTQSAISREIKTLEEQIGLPLFHRVHRALQLTSAGEELYRAADEALYSAKDAGRARVFAAQASPATLPDADADSDAECVVIGCRRTLRIDPDFGAWVIEFAAIRGRGGGRSE